MPEGGEERKIVKVKEEVEYSSDPPLKSGREIGKKAKEKDQPPPPPQLTTTSKGGVPKLRSPQIVEKMEEKSQLSTKSEAPNKEDNPSPDVETKKRRRLDREVDKSRDNLSKEPPPEHKKLPSHPVFGIPQLLILS